MTTTVQTARDAYRIRCELDLASLRDHYGGRDTSTLRGEFAWHAAAGYRGEIEHFAFPLLLRSIAKALAAPQARRATPDSIFQPEGPWTAIVREPLDYRVAAEVTLPDARSKPLLQFIDDILTSALFVEYRTATLYPLDRLIKHSPS